MEVNRTEKITFRCTALEKAALAEQAARCGISTSEYCRTLALGGRPKERYTEEERELFREIARLKGTLQRLNNYFGGRFFPLEPLAALRVSLCCWLGIKEKNGWRCSGLVLCVFPCGMYI